MEIKVLLGCTDEGFATRLRFLLEKKHVQFQVASTSEECIKFGEECCPDAVIFDDSLLGEEMVEIVQRTREQLDVPILVLSRSSSPLAIVQALDAGADDHITKPVHAELLILRLRLLVRCYSR